MNDLKDLWREARYATPAAGPDNLTYLKDVNDQLHSLRKREELSEKWKPFTYLFIGLMSAGLMIFFYTVGAISSAFGLVGVILVLAAGLCLVTAAYAVRIPMDDFDLAAPSAYFLNDIKTKLNARARNFRWGMVAQLILLSAGLFLLYWQDGLPQQNLGAWVGTQAGITFGLCGLVYGLSSASFKYMHAGILEVIAESGADELV